jgi:hypothetical protein
MKISWKKVSLGKERRLTAAGTRHDHPHRIHGTPYLAHRILNARGSGLILSDARGRLVHPLVLAPGECGPLRSLPGGDVGLFAYRPDPEQSWSVQSVTLSNQGAPEVQVVLEGQGINLIDPVAHPNGRSFLLASDEGSPGCFHLWEAHPGKQEKRPLTAHPDRSDDQPTISPSGRFLVFRGSQGERSDLFLLDRKTEATRRLTAAPGASQEPVFLDEFRLIFSRKLPEGDQGLLLLDILQGREKWITGVFQRPGQPTPGLSPKGRLCIWYSAPNQDQGMDIYSGNLLGLREDDA